MNKEMQIIFSVWTVAILKHCSGKTSSLLKLVFIEKHYKNYKAGFNFFLSFSMFAKQSA
jgi:hypothetical protein